MKTPYDEMLGADKDVREQYRVYEQWLRQQPHAALAARRAEAEVIFRRVGITFAVYGAKDEDGAGTERLIPFDVIPRVIPKQEWTAMEAGLRQRVTALNRFIHDVYHDQEILKAGVVPRDQVLNNSQFRPEMMGVDVPGGVYAHIGGIDIVRAGEADGSGRYYVLEDNLRVPSGVSYMLEDRKMMMRLFPELFARTGRARGALSRPAAGNLARGGAGRRERADRRRADAGHVQLRLLRARLPGAADGRRARRRAGPVRARRLRLHAHDAGAEAGGRDLPTRRRRLHRPADLPRRYHARLRRADGRLPRRQHHAGNAIGTGIADDKCDLSVRAAT